MTHPLYQLNEQLRFAAVLASRRFIPRTFCRFTKRRPGQIRDQLATASPHWRLAMTLPRTSRPPSANVTRWVDVRPTFSRDDDMLRVATESGPETYSRLAPRQQRLCRKTPRFDNLIRFTHHRQHAPQIQMGITACYVAYRQIANVLQWHQVIRLL